MTPAQQRPYGAKTYSEVLEEGLQYIEDRKKGKIQSFKTPWPTLNQAGVGGLEWNSIVTIGARPGSGKTMFVSQMLRESRILNPGQDFNILEFQFEMGAKQSATRSFVAATALDYNLVLSTTKELDDFSLKMMKQYTEEAKELERQGVHRLQINTPLTHSDIEKAIHVYYNTLGGKPMIISLDHSWLVKKSKEEREKISTLYNTVEVLMKVKNELPIIVFIISQLNRSIDEPVRKIPGNIANYPTSSDIFGGDALQQGSDMVLVLTRPFKADIPIYGPKQFMCKSEDLFLHILKSRNGSDDTNLVFLNGDFKRQKMVEAISPISVNPTPAFTARRNGGNGRTRDTADINI